jgi:hypothetical protein
MWLQIPMALLCGLLLEPRTEVVEAMGMWICFCLNHFWDRVSGAALPKVVSDGVQAEHLQILPLSV